MQGRMPRIGARQTLDRKRATSYGRADQVGQGGFSMGTAMQVSLLCGTLLAGLVLVPDPAQAQERGQEATLERGFADPPAEARPMVWWHWMDGNISLDGIDKDLDWFRRIGLGGLQNFDAGLPTQKVVPDRLVYMSPAWKEALAHAVKRADAYGLSYGTAASPGWSVTGAPWVAPSDAMKKLVWTEQMVTGGRRVETRLPALPTVVGPYQHIARGDGKLPGGSPGTATDALVLAYPAVAEDKAPEDGIAEVTVAGFPVDGTVLQLPPGTGAMSISAGSVEQPTDIMLRYVAPREVRSATIFLPGAADTFQAPRFLPVLEARVDGQWRQLAEMPIAQVPTTVSFPAVRSNAFRLVLRTQPNRVRPVIDNPAPGVDVGINPHEAGRNVALATFTLSETARVDRFETKAGFSVTADYYALERPDDDATAIAPGQVVDLTGKMDASGMLRWDAPPGRWRIVRLGYGLLGTVNHPAPAEATGLEVDKLDPQAVTRYFQTYLGSYKAALGPRLFGKRGLRTVVTDSIEAGNANWTPGLIAEFRARRGYDPVPFLPALTGTIVESRARSDGFLYDYRRTLAELLASAHYGTLAKIARAQGLTLFGEALETGRPQLGDDIAMRSHADVPMAALWAFNPALGPNPTYVGDMRGAASVAHAYGRNYAAAETMTAGLASYAFAPSDLKRVVDLAFASGINRPVIHSSVHQPVDGKRPGLTLGGFGQYFNRHESWAEFAKAWVDYIARSSFLLQQGRNVADIAYFIGEEAPITALTANGAMGPASPDYGYDYVNAEIIAREMSVDKGEIVTRGGARYRALYLGGTSRFMTLPTLRALARLVDAGATVIGEAPIDTPSAADDPRVFAALVDRLWRHETVIATSDLAAAARQAGIAPDVTFAGSGAVSFVHRALPQGGDIYFLRSTDDQPRQIEASFRVSGLEPELWNAETGRRTPLSYWTRDGRTIVPLDLHPEDALFVLFRRKTKAPERRLPKPAPLETRDISTGWSVNFADGIGAAQGATMGLTPWNRSSDPAVRYYSGIATYTRQVDVAAHKDRATLLDLGAIGDIARIRVNGVDAGTVWHAPFQIDIGHLLRPGQNMLTVEVANLWVNRLIGDAQPDAQGRTFTTAIPYLSDAPLRPSGLFGPVRLLSRSLDGANQLHGRR
jgi:hypothetical protein